MDPVGQQDSRASIFEYVLTYHDSYEYRFSWLSCLTQIKVVTSSALRRRFKIQRRQATPSERLSMGETLYHKFNGSRAVRKQRLQAIDYINDKPLSAPQDVSLRLESLVLIPIPPPIASSSRCEGSSLSGVPLDLISRDIESHHEFVEEWVLRLSIGKALQYGIRWEKVPGEEPCK